ncbi:hypothetical protein GCM10011519_15070 [Marmoricola endophyticus]|uniref:HTH arsR-type domain-containing protein n=1 Tax=Marmoricola endophyticus TaxID=2040280 RepID=A0A917F2N7_9ACTN|nr:metalloregulator ArsR/SmtB family transcription factor [Marmoricola endophyticus]GGF42212.1 hypothetical protein GCM10011519_15070 [Marmoricola endophyticus]
MPGEVPDGLDEVAHHVFAALADPTRRAILTELAQTGPLTATDLASRLPITRQGVAKHVALLVEAGLVVPEPGEGRRVRHRLDPAPMRVAERYLVVLARDWDGRLERLRDHVEESRSTT